MWARSVPQPPWQAGGRAPVKGGLIMKSKGTAIVLALLLGGIGGHKFYLGQAGMGLLYLLFCWTGIPLVISLLEVILLAVMPEQTFHQRFSGASVASIEPTKACPFCAEQIKVAAVTCRYCHKDMPR